MSRDRTEELLIRCVEYIGETVGNSVDAYDVMTNVIGFTETELDSFVYGETDPTDDNMKSISIENNEYNKLPNEIHIPLSGDYGDDLFDQICEYTSDFISEKMGFCHEGFDIDIQITASNIKWDMSE